MSNPKSLFPNLLFLSSFSHTLLKKHTNHKNIMLHKENYRTVIGLSSNSQFSNLINARNLFSQDMLNLIILILDFEKT